jgi:hypothetical protein
MPDERPRFGRYDQRQDALPCASRGARPHDGCAQCAERVLRPYRVVRRYRGDRVAQGLDPAKWCVLWQLQAGDVSWPGSREG